ncbi:hypothetical protein [uncultured Moraxella sp.]|uniref:hypothetical protein n=1 Tax=uncultured Moraxella sp. TaxID=263769 RepID=UPI0025E59B5D|nr:hypothetical protein [uncultured Moraxella sp.]
MRSIKDKLMRKIVDTQPPEGFWYKMETKNEIKDTDKMHGIQARSILSFAVFGAYLVGNKQYFDPFLPGLIRWCQTAIELKVESGWKPQDVCLIYEGYAGSTWVYTGQDDVAIWKECLEYTNLWFFAEKNPTDFSKTKAKGIEINLFYTYLQRCLFAKEYKLGIDVYEYFKGKKEVKLTSKTGLVTLMYAVLRHYEYGEFDKARLNKVCRQVLGKELKFVYSKGCLDDAVYWLKTMCALRDRLHTPEEVVLTFYEFLEDDEIPDELKPLLKQKDTLTRTELIAQKLI